MADIKGLSSYQTYLMQGTGEGDSLTWAKLIDIKEFPDLGGEPERLDITTLSDPMRLYIPGIQDTESMSVTANYTPENFATIKALEGQNLNLAIWFGATTSGSTDTPDGSYGKFSFEGQVNTYVNGAGVNEVVDMTISITPSTAIQFEAGESGGGGSE